MNNPTQKNLNTEITTGLAGFFDLLAKFDFEDQKKAELEINFAPLVSAPKGVKLEANSKNKV